MLGLSGFCLFCGSSRLSCWKWSTWIAGSCGQQARLCEVGRGWAKTFPSAGGSWRRDWGTRRASPKTFKTNGAPCRRVPSLCWRPTPWSQCIRCICRFLPGYRICCWAGSAYRAALSPFLVIWNVTFYGCRYNNYGHLGWIIKIGVLTLDFISMPATTIQKKCLLCIC